LQYVNLLIAVDIRRQSEIVLPKGLRRVRDHGYLHGNAKSLLQKIQLQLKVNPI
jgi:hypothetical protein